MSKKAFLFLSAILAVNLGAYLREVSAQDFSTSLKMDAIIAGKWDKPEEREKWFEKVVAESYGYYWSADGNVTHRHLWEAGGLYGFSHLKYNTDSDLYIVGVEAGYRVGLPGLKRITVGFETSQGSSDSMHGTDSDPAFSDRGRTNFLGYLSYQKHSGEDRAKYIRPAVYIRPIEGRITNKITGYLDVLGEYIRYKDNVYIAQVTDVIPGTSGTFAAVNNPFKIRFEGAGGGFRGGFRLLDMLKLEGLFSYYPDMSVKRTLLWDVPINRKFVFTDGHGRGFTSRMKLGFTPFKKRQNLEVEAGYQYMQFEQHGGQGRWYRFSDGNSDTIENWERARSIRDGFFGGGTIRW